MSVEPKPGRPGAGGGRVTPGPGPGSGRAATFLGAIGDTPLVRLRLDDLPEEVALLAKVEGVNPGGSLKDRPVARIMTSALRRGELGGGRRLLDSSSGNAGIAYAMLGAALGVPVTLVVPGNASRERIDRLRAHGAELILTDPMEGYDAAVEEARRLARERPDRYWFADQYGNDDNWRAHFETTGPEILEGLRRRGLGPPDALVLGVGTGGTLTGVGRRLRRARPDVHIARVRPERFPGIEGLKPLGEPGDIVPEILDPGLADEVVDVTVEESVAACRALARQGLFVGPSSGCYVAAAVRLARRGRHECIVTVLNDTGERYVSTGMWEER